MAAPPAPAAARSAIAAHLATAFALVDTPPRAWARAFLLDDNPAATLAVLTNRAAAPFSVTSTSVDTAFETVPPADGREAFDSRFAFDALLVPSFSAAGLGVGVVVNRIVAVAAGGMPAPGSDAKARCRFAAQVARGGGAPRLPPTSGSGGVGDADYKYSLGKYVRDERNGTLLIVKHTGVGSGGSGTGGTQVMYLEHLSTTRRYRMYFHCDTAQFKAGKLVDSVLACVTNTEARHCPVCREGPGANCECRLELEPPKDPFDFRGSAKAMASQSGDYLGQAGITISLRDKRAEVPAGVEKPRRYVSAPLISSLRTASFSASRCDATHDALAAVLQNFAVQTSLSEASIDRGLSAAPPSVPGLLPPSLAPVDSEEPGASPVEVPAGAGMQALGQIGSEDGLASVGSAVPDQVTDFASALLNDGTGDCDPAMVLPHEPTDMLDSYLLLDQDDRLDDPKLFVGELSGDSLNCTLKEMASTDDSRGQSENASSSVPEAIAQRGKTGVRGKECANAEIAARELRRRTKNRESAARANARKKAMNDELKANIRDAQARAAALQARQTELLKENIGLRREVGIIHLRKAGARAAPASEDGKKSGVDDLRVNVVKMEDTTTISSAKLVEAAVAAVAASRSSAGPSIDAL